MSHAAGGSLFVIGGAVAVMAQNNGKYIEPLMPQESYDNEMRSHGNSPGEEYANFKKEFDEDYPFDDCEICGSKIFKKRIKVNK